MAISVVSGADVLGVSPLPVILFSSLVYLFLSVKQDNCGGKMRNLDKSGLINLWQCIFLGLEIQIKLSFFNSRQNKVFMRQDLYRGVNNEVRFS